MTKQNKRLLDFLIQYTTQNFEISFQSLKFQNKQTTYVDLKHDLHDFTCALTSVRKRLPLSSLQETEETLTVHHSAFIDACEVCDIFTTHTCQTVSKNQSFWWMFQLRIRNISRTKEILSPISRKPLVTAILCLIDNLVTEFSFLYSNESFQ